MRRDERKEVDRKGDEKKGVERRRDDREGEEMGVKGRV